MIRVKVRVSLHTTQYLAYYTVHILANVVYFVLNLAVQNKYYKDFAFKISYTTELERQLEHLQVTPVCIILTVISYTDAMMSVCKMEERKRSG